MSNITFPTLTLSAPPEVEWGILSNTQESMTSPLNASVQTIGQPGARWKQRFTFSTLIEADAALLQQHLVTLDGKANRSLLPMFARPLPRGTISLTGVTVTAAVAQGLNVCSLSGCGASATLMPGDFFAIGFQVVMVTGIVNFTANGAGVMAGVAFAPFVRPVTGWAAAAAVVTNNPRAAYIQASEESLWRTRAPILTDVPFDFVEAFQ